MHGQRLTDGSSDGPFGTAHESIDAVVLQPEVVVEAARAVLLDDERAGPRRAATRPAGAAPA